MAQDPFGRDFSVAEPLDFPDRRAAAAMSAAGMGEFEWEMEEDRLIVSPRMAAITGLPAGSMPAEGGQAVFSYVHPDDVEALRHRLTESLRAHGRYELEFRMIRPDDGRVLYICSAGVAPPASSGGGRRLIGVVQDITQRHAEDDARNALVAELDHRVKNVLASVQSLAAQSARKTTSLDAFLKTFAGRLEAMASAHTLLTATRWRGAEIGNVATAELGGLAPGQARWSGPEILLNPRATNALTLALHELATNAVKFGALSTENGRVEVRVGPARRRRLRTDLDRARRALGRPAHPARLRLDAARAGHRPRARRRDAHRVPPRRACA